MWHETTGILLQHYITSACGRVEARQVFWLRRSDLIRYTGKAFLIHWYKQAISVQD